MTLWVAGVWGVYRIFPISRGFRACQIILDIGFESMFFTRLLQYGAENTRTQDTHIQDTQRNTHTRRTEINPDWFILVAKGLFCQFGG